MKVLGIDEAGRGPVIGPMMVCGYMIDENSEELRTIKPRDSKTMTSNSRKAMYDKLKSVSIKSLCVTVNSDEIDKAVEKKKLNVLELEKMTYIINKLKPDKAIIDCPEANTEKFKAKVYSMIDFKCEIVCENKADSKHLEVAAASIIAKVDRDAVIEEFSKKYGKIGSGYPSDERTIKFLKDCVKYNSKYPDIVRKSWATAKNIINDTK